MQMKFFSMTIIGLIFVAIAFPFFSFLDLGKVDPRFCIIEHEDTVTIATLSSDEVLSERNFYAQKDIQKLVDNSPHKKLFYLDKTTNDWTKTKCPIKFSLMTFFPPTYLASFSSDRTLSSIIKNIKDKKFELFIHKSFFEKQFFYDKNLFKNAVNYLSNFHEMKNSKFISEMNILDDETHFMPPMISRTTLLREFYFNGSLFEVSSKTEAQGYSIKQWNIYSSGLGKTECGEDGFCKTSFERDNKNIQAYVTISGSQKSMISEASSCLQKTYEYVQALNLGENPVIKDAESLLNCAKSSPELLGTLAGNLSYECPDSPALYESILKEFLKHSPFGFMLKFDAYACSQKIGLKDLAQIIKFGTLRGYTYAHWTYGHIPSEEQVEKLVLRPNIKLTKLGFLPQDLTFLDRDRVNNNIARFIADILLKDKVELLKNYISRSDRDGIRWLLANYIEIEKAGNTENLKYLYSDLLEKRLLTNEELNRALISLNATPAALNLSYDEKKLKLAQMSKSEL